LCQGIRDRGTLNPIYAADPSEAFDLLPNVIENGDVLLVQGAGT
jgi:UDP-N-acetylmuramate--alanine ligase